MDRITVRDKHTGAWTANCDLCEIGRWASTCDGNCHLLRERLAAIEDILGDNYDLDHLRELMTAEREGRIYIAPCDEED